MNVTQTEIDEATLLVKNMAYKLAYELALEKKYGGNPDCCFTNLKRLWMWARLLSCQTAITSSSAEIELSSVSVGDSINIYFDGEPISSTPMTSGTTNITNAMKGIAAYINANASGYSATYNGDKRSGVVDITGPCSNPTLSITILSGSPGITSSGFTGGYCENKSCLTNEKIKNLIAKIRSMCKG